MKVFVKDPNKRTFFAFCRFFSDAPATFTATARFGGWSKRLFKVYARWYVASIRLSRRRKQPVRASPPELCRGDPVSCVLMAAWNRSRWRGVPPTTFVREPTACLNRRGSSPSQSNMCHCSPRYIVSLVPCGSTKLATSTGISFNGSNWLKAYGRRHFQTEQ